MVTFSDLDISRYLNTEEKRLAYLNAILEDADEAQIKRALQDIAKAKGKVLKPPYKNFWQTLKELGIKLEAKTS
ncbi:DNA-binding protein [Helicobacter ailurogastricus]|uniref:Uncharacterized protein n=1 Tax=Helicobacter ailurogastricus TaxID=1578720 RepID=A0A0K2X8X0_9HELI|nr:hypothetical protein [Helicobacter ailurogastricus]CRF41799.1 hypothetical protein HAL011_16160 [Helicobacter ailurogastricus]CRF42521.1 hypothetical protein HAL013_07090 [Helicobacter ailurogastricus]CRF44173.1 hypothetical protein HAL09_07460 [Helicobacter ailurogastricus]GMB90625.1 hypothetical protein NHP190002_13300 [Helicobacter ailurogastricus]GMB92212.1 hypothetical protein NHP190009_13950 [Helicobacter ailurogastricus]